MSKFTFPAFALRKLIEKSLSHLPSVHAQFLRQQLKTQNQTGEDCIMFRAQILMVSLLEAKKQTDLNAFEEDLRSTPWKPLSPAEHYLYSHWLGENPGMTLALTRKGISDQHLNLIKQYFIR